MSKHTMLESVAQDIDAGLAVVIHKANAGDRASRPHTLDDLYADAPAGPRDSLVLDLAKRFWQRVDRRGKDECWEWEGATTGEGYGVISYGGRNLYTHRLAYIFEHPEGIPEGASVLHDCGVFGNPLCCNPAHLRTGTGSENMADAIRHKGPGAFMARLSISEAEEIRALYAASRMTYRELAKKFGVSTRTVGNVINGRTYRNAGEVA